MSRSDLMVDRIRSSVFSSPRRPRQTKRLPSSMEAALRDEALRSNASTLENGGLVWLEHINLAVGSRETTRMFYFAGMGFTEDPRKDATSTTIWANVGPMQQLHLSLTAEGERPHVVNGTIGLAVHSLDALAARLSGVALALAATRMCFDPAPVALDDGTRALTVVGPWGNRFVCYEVGDRAAEPFASPDPDDPVMAQRHANWDDDMSVRGSAGIRFVHFRITGSRGRGAPAKAARFYSTVFGSPANSCSSSSSSASRDAAGAEADFDIASVNVGQGTHFIFTQSTASGAGAAEAEAENERIERQRGVHVCVYTSTFEASFEALHARGLTGTNSRFRYLDRCDTLEEAQRSRQFRFYHITDLDGEEEGSSDGATTPLLELEHETRCLRHSSFMQPLVWAPQPPQPPPPP